MLQNSKSRIQKLEKLIRIYSSKAAFTVHCNEYTDGQKDRDIVCFSAVQNEAYSATTVSIAQIFVSMSSEITHSAFAGVFLDTIAPYFIWHALVTLAESCSCAKN